jgi:hypothetical protein
MRAGYEGDLYLHATTMTMAGIAWQSAARASGFSVAIDPRPHR